MSNPIQKKTTKREFLKILGLSSASLLASGVFADELLYKVSNGCSSPNARIPVAVRIKPNAFKLECSDPFSTTIVFPEAYGVDDVDFASVKCEGAPALGSVILPENRAIVFLYDGGDLRDDLPPGFSLRFTVTGRLHNGSIFTGYDTVAVIGADQSIIFHTSTRKRRSCSACKSHAVNRMYSSAQAADDDRAHPGCKCRIVQEQIGWKDYVRAFWHSSPGGATVHDKRWGWPATLPAELSLECPPALKEHLGRG